MKKLKLFIVTLILSVTMVSSSIFVFADSDLALGNKAFEEKVINYVIDNVKSAYEKDYTISDISGVVNEITKEDDGTHVSVNISLKRILLEKSANELKYVQGLEAAAASLEDNDKKAAAEEYIANLKDDLNNNYIGVEQEENDTFNVVIPTSSLTRSKNSINIKTIDSLETDDIKISFEGLTGDYPLDSIEAPSDEELFKDGENTISTLEATVESTKSTNRLAKASGATPQDYDRIDARDYALSYSNSDGDLYTTTNYNPNYVPYNPNDCANFVSQCIYAGGIETDSQWKPYITCWNTTGHDGYGLVDYMTGKGLFFRSTVKSKAFAGSIIYWQNVSHVGLIDKNDTKKMTFCAHSRNRNQCSFVNERNIEFYIPVWDSYYNSWTPQ